MESRTREASRVPPDSLPLHYNGHPRYQSAMIQKTTMQVTLEVPEEFARLFATSAAGRSRAALEALALEGLRAGKITVTQARDLLGIPSRYEMDGFLKAHDILLPLTLETLEQDTATVRRFRNQ